MLDLHQAATCARRLTVIPLFPRAEDALAEIGATLCRTCETFGQADRLIDAFQTRHGDRWPGPRIFQAFCESFSRSTSEATADVEPQALPSYYGHQLPYDGPETIETIDADAELRIAALKPQARHELEQRATAEYNARRSQSQAQRRESERIHGPSPLQAPAWWSEPYRTNLIRQFMRQEMLRHLEVKILRGEPLPPIPTSPRKDPKA